MLLWAISSQPKSLRRNITAIIEATPHDHLEFDGGAGANWTEVLAVYAVLVATDIDNPIEVATLDDAKIQKLRDVFFDMNVINYSTYEVVTGYDEETDTEYTETVLSITVTGKTAEEMIVEYGFNDEQAEQLRELLNPEYAELFALLIGGSITLSAVEITEIMATLPDDLSEERLEVVLTAYSLLGKVNYFWGGKSLVIGWDSRWRTPTRVTANGSSSTGAIRPYGLDCSGFADWLFYNAYDGEYIIGHGGGAFPHPTKLQNPEEKASAAMAPFSELSAGMKPPKIKWPNPKLTLQLLQNPWCLCHVSQGYGLIFKKNISPSMSAISISIRGRKSRIFCCLRKRRCRQ